jgi:alpha-beta hydrolase superfamily lysophospholipase
MLSVGASVSFGHSSSFILLSQSILFWNIYFNLSGIYQDAEAAFEWLLKREDIDSKKIFILGSSLGGAVSIKLTSNPQYAGHIAGLMLENTFTSLPDVAKSLFSLKALDFLPTFCYKNQVRLHCLDAAVLV